MGLFKALLERDFEIFSFDLAGHGRSSTTRFAAPTAAAGILDAAERSGARERGLPLHAVGISLGGALLLHALPSLPQVASAVLMVTPLTIEFSWRSVRGELGIPLLRALWRGRQHYGLTGLVPSFGPVKRSSYPLRLSDEPGPGPFGYVEVLNSGLQGLRLEAAARSVRAPVLLVYGDGDRIVPPAQGERLARLIPRSELLRLPGETHLSAPLAPAAVDRTVAWMEKHRVPGTGYRGGRRAPGTGDSEPATGQGGVGREGREP